MVVCFTPVAQLAGISVVLPLALAVLLRCGRPSLSTTMSGNSVSASVRAPGLETGQRLGPCNTA